MLKWCPLHEYYSTVYQNYYPSPWKYNPSSNTKNQHGGTRPGRIYREKHIDVEYKTPLAKAIFQLLKYKYLILSKTIPAL